MSTSFQSLLKFIPIYLTVNVTWVIFKFNQGIIKFR